MNILHLISSNGMYGAERVIVTLSEALRDGGHRSVVAAFENRHNPNLEVLAEAQRRGLETETIPCNGRFDLGTVKRIRTLLARHRPDILHTHGYKTDIFGYLAARGSNTKLVATCHTWYDNDLAATFYGKLDRMVLRSYDLTVAVSESVANRLRDAHVSDKKIRLIDNGIDVSQFADAQPTLHFPNATCIVGVVARLAPEKGIHHLLEAAALLQPHTPGVVYLIVGDGPQRAELEKTAHELNLDEQVFFLGKRDDMPGVYASLDILVQPSLNEGLPMTLLEALAAKRAVVATAVGAVPSVIINEKTGLLVPPGDPEALARAIESLVNNESMRHELGCEGRRLIDARFSARRMAQDYILLYEEVVGLTTPQRSCV